MIRPDDERMAQVNDGATGYSPAQNAFLGRPLNQLITYIGTQTMMPTQHTVMLSVMLSAICASKLASECIRAWEQNDRLRDGDGAWRDPNGQIRLCHSITEPLFLNRSDTDKMWVEVNTLIPPGFDSHLDDSPTSEEWRMSTWPRFFGRTLYDLWYYDKQLSDAEEFSDEDAQNQHTERVADHWENSLLVATYRSNTESD